MAVGETLLKITDFPFAYSFTALIVGMLGLSIQDSNLLVFLAAAGSLGTFLTITDPFGRLFKLISKKHFQRKKFKDANFPAKQKHTIRAIYSRSIGVEIDKFVSIGYFIIILYLFSSFINTNPSFAEQFQLIQKDGNVLCDTECISNVGNWVGYSAALAVFVVVYFNVRELRRRIVIAGIHQWGIGSEFVTSKTIDNMSKAIQQNDWETAEEWSKLIENEIKTEKGIKDFNIDAVREVYRPIFEESMNIEATLKVDFEKNVFSQLPGTKWFQIKRSAANLMIKDEDLRNKLDTMYESIRKYNRILSSLEKEINNVIISKATEFYGKRIESISYFFQTERGGTAPALWDCLFQGKHPRERQPKEYKTTYIELYLPKQRIDKLVTKEEFEKFDELWNILVDEVNNKTGLLEMKKLHSQIQPMNNELKPKIEEQIRKQWL